MKKIALHSVAVKGASKRITTIMENANAFLMLSRGASISQPSHRIHSTTSHHSFKQPVCLLASKVCCFLGLLVEYFFTFNLYNIVLKNMFAIKWCPAKTTTQNIHSLQHFETNHQPKRWYGDGDGGAQKNTQVPGQKKQKHIIACCLLQNSNKSEKNKGKRIK